jgi:hypothetical protein
MMSGMVGKTMNDVNAFAVVYLAEALDRTRESITAWETLDDLIRTNPRRAWKVILALVRLAPDHLLPVIGAGPLETLLVRYPRPFVRISASTARRNSRFRDALQHVYTDDLSETDRLHIIEALTSSESPPPRPR